MAPVAISIAFVPVLIGRLGTERFGVLVLVWALVGYAGVLDLGLGRALARIVARRRNSDGSSALDAPLLRTGLVCLLVLGVVLGVTVVATSTLLVSSLDASSAVTSELREALPLCGLTIVLTVVYGGAIGVVEGGLQFRRANLSRIAIGILTVGGATIVSAVWTDLTSLIWCLAIARLAGLGILYSPVLAYLGPRLRSHGLSSRKLREFLHEAKWLSLSNLIGPVLTLGDRLAIWGSVPAGIAAYYLTPLEVVSKILIVPGAVMNALFPRFAALELDPFQLRRVLLVGTASIIVLVLPLVVVILVFGQQLLTVWIDSAFADQSHSVAGILALGVLANSVACVPFAYLQSTGMAHRAAIIHFVEAPVYVCALIYVAPRYGITGIAVVWTSRMVLDSLGQLTAALTDTQRRIREFGVLATKRVGGGDLDEVLDVRRI